jgi:serine/threonine-protein kinase 19
MEEKKQSDLEIFKLFKMHVLDSKLEPSIGHHELLSLLSLGGKVKDAHITLLINAGLLTRQLIDPDMYWFAIPSTGKLWKGLSQVPLFNFLSISSQVIASSTFSYS